MSSFATKSDFYSEFQVRVFMKAVVGQVESIVLELFGHGNQKHGSKER